MDRLVEQALNEDLGSGDITTQGILSQDPIIIAELTAKEPLVLCGLVLAEKVFTHLDPEAFFPISSFNDGDEVAAGTVFLAVRALGSALLQGERVALNILQRLSGIATLTRQFVQQAAPVTVLDTRKTTPGLRVFEKYAVKCGGGSNHRFGLFDAVMIKDNHIRLAGGIKEATANLRGKLPYAPSIEIETTCLGEVRQALDANADTIMLDNMDLDEMKEAVKLIAGRAKVEASGSMTLKRVAELADSGVDFVSVGAITHSSPAVDISMNFTEILDPGNINP
jgi:nicotinate-nucleotide pyrophosphorylase (carboxylating)